LNHLRRKKDDDSTLFSSDDDDNGNPYHIFTGTYEDIVESNLKNWFFTETKCDYDMPRTYFPLGYLPDANNKDDNSTGKMAHDEMRVVLLMRGVLLMILLLLSTAKHKNPLMEKVGAYELQCISSCLN